MTALAASLVLAAMTVAHAGDLPDMRGSTVPPYPAPFVSDFGTCIGTGEDICAYSVETLNDGDGNILAVLGGKGVNADADAPRSVVLDVLPVPPMATDETWAMDGCTFGGAMVPGVVAVVEYRQEGDVITVLKTVWAAQFDTKASAFHRLPPAEVACQLLWD